MKVDNVLKEMERIVERRMERYKTDFYDYDIESINMEKPRELAWMVRPTGTHLMSDKEVERIGGDMWKHCYELFKGANKWFYYVRLNADGSGEVTLSEKRCDEFAARMSRKQRSIA